MMLDLEEARLQLRILEAIRHETAVTRPDIARLTGLGRTIVTQRVDRFIDLGLVKEGETAPVPRGRSPRSLRFNRYYAEVLVADVGVKGIFVGMACLGGVILERSFIPNDVSKGPRATLAVIRSEFDRILANRASVGVNPWGIAVGLPAPVEFDTGRPVSPLQMPGWNEADLRTPLQDEYRVPVWVDNDVNLMALGELRAGAAQGARDAVLMDVGQSIGSALISDGHLHRGAQGAAGDIGHERITDDPSAICWCGKVGCLDAVSSGYGLEQLAGQPAAAQSSPFLAGVAEDHEPTLADIVRGAEMSDAYCLALAGESARGLGESLAHIVNFFNPGTVLLGGSVTEFGDVYLAAVRNIVYARSVPLATRELVITRSELGERAAMIGGAHLVIEELLEPHYYARWGGEGVPPLL